MNRPDITAADRKRIYETIAKVGTGAGAISAAVTPLMPLLPEGGVYAAVATALLSAAGWVARWAGRLAADHTIVDEALDIIDAVPGN